MLTQLAENYNKRAGRRPKGLIEEGLLHQNKTNKSRPPRSRMLRDFFKWLAYKGTERIPCYYCKKEILEREATVEHVTPLWVGGKDEIKNMQIACDECNQAMNKAWQQNRVEEVKEVLVKGAEE